MNAIKPGTKTRLRILFSVLLCAIIIGTTPRAMREFYYRGAFIHYRGILRLVLLIMLPLLLLSYIAFISELKQSQKKLMLNVIRWYGVILYCAILGFVFFGGDRRDYDYSGLTPNYIPFFVNSKIHQGIPNGRRLEKFDRNIRKSSAAFSPFLFIVI